MSDRKRYDWQGIRSGLIKGRIRTPDKPMVPNPIAPPFHEALAEASVDDLMWALHLLIIHPNTKRRTFRAQRMKAIADRLQEIAT